MALLAGCAGAPTYRVGVDSRMILPPLAPTHQVRTDQRFLMASPIDAPVPVYPSEQAARVRPPVTVCLEAVVDVHGAVASTRALVVAGECADTAGIAARPYLAAAARALRSWTFFAAAICTPRPGDSQCEAVDANLAPVASRMAYRFTFHHADGRPRVESRRR
ncbi:MAG: hypothetical protein M3Q40_03045 [Pseudomonadota bacterium]|nr:hypothetical protein [Pseudomonadota bacterium]